MPVTPARGEAAHPAALPPADSGAGSGAGPALAVAAKASRGRASAQALAARAPSPGRLDRAVRPSVPKPPKAPKPPPAAKPAPGYAPAAKATGEWAFLDDRRLSIEDKLFQFMKKAMEKADQELVAQMKAYRARFGAGGAGAAPGAPAATAKKGGTSVFDVVKAVVPALGVAEKVFGAAGVKRAAGALGGPVLAAAATAVGLPQLAPLALQYGGDLAQLAFQEVGGKAPAASTAAKAEAGSPDEKVAMLELERLVQKQQQMFTAVANTLRALHETQMAAIHNIR
jgi:hypothetical protein